MANAYFTPPLRLQGSRRHQSQEHQRRQREAVRRHPDPDPARQRSGRRSGAEPDEERLPALHGSKRAPSCSPSRRCSTMCPIVLTNPGIWDALGLPLTPFNDSRTSDPLTLTESDIQPVPGSLGQPGRRQDQCAGDRLALGQAGPFRRHQPDRYPELRQLPLGQEGQRRQVQPLQGGVRLLEGSGRQRLDRQAEGDVGFDPADP